MSDAKRLLEARAISKSFGANRVLQDVNLAVAPGQLVAVMGENGAGKSTLMKIVAGVYPAGSYGGDVTWDGRPIRFHGPAEAKAAGIGLIQQEIQLVPQLSVAANVWLGQEAREWLNEAEHMDRTREILERLGCPIDPAIPVGRLSLSQQQLVEIAKALSLRPRLLVFDEPTSSLTEREVHHLFGVIRELKAQGTAILYISHKMDEVMQLADAVMVLRDGVTAAAGPIANFTEADLIEKMVGRQVTQRFPSWESRPAETVLTLTDVTFQPAVPGRRNLYGISLDVGKGEVLGLAGIVGAGRTELLEFLFGAIAGPWTGEVSWQNRSYRPSDPAHAMASGMALVTEDRKGSGLILQRSVGDNLTLGHLAAYARAGWIDRKRESGRIAQLIDELLIRTHSADMAVGALSGGNQQKVVVGKWLDRRPTLLLLDEPTRGVDVGAKAEIYTLIRRLAQSGVAIIMASSELPEVLGLSDRVAVMADGTVRGILKRAQATPEAVMELATGGKT